MHLNKSGEPRPWLQRAMQAFVAHGTSPGTELCGTGGEGGWQKGIAGRRCAEQGEHGVFPPLTVHPR